MALFPIYPIGGGQWIALQVRSVDLTIAVSGNEIQEGADVAWDKPFTIDPTVIAVIGQTGDGVGNADNWTAADGLLSVAMSLVTRAGSRAALARTLAPASTAQRRVIIMAMGVVAI